MTSPKRHHFVPEMLLRRFGDSSGRIHFFDRRRPGLGVRRTTPTQLFCQTHLYSEIDASGARTTAFEARLARQESVATVIIDRILDAARRDVTPNLDAEERAAWDAFFAMQWRRVPDVHRQSPVLANAEQEILNLLAVARKRYPHRQDEVDRLSAPAEVRRMTQNARVNALARPAAGVQAALASRGLAIVRIVDDRRSFVIGSLPVVKLTRPGRTDLRDHDVEMWLPIASDVAVGVGLEPGREMLVPTRDHSLVRRMNEAITRQSSMVAGRSAALIRSLGENAETLLDPTPRNPANTCPSA